MHNPGFQPECRGGVPEFGGSPESLILGNISYVTQCAVGKWVRTSSTLQREADDSCCERGASTAGSIACDYKFEIVFHSREGVNSVTQSALASLGWIDL